MITTITTDEAAKRLREVGMSTSPTTLRDGIEQRRFPFGDCVVSSAGTRTFYVYARLLDEWIKERSDGN